MAAARASHHLPLLQDAEIGDDLLQLLGEGVVSLEHMEEALKEAGMPIGPRVALLAVLEKHLL